MATEHKDRESIVSRALEIESAKERDRYISEACGDDDKLKQRVKEEVEEHSREDGEDSERPDNGDASPERRAPKQGKAGHTESREQPLTRIGPYKVLKLLAEGGTGTLFRAEQQEPVRRQVALRLIREGRDWEQVLARLQAERPTLERMDHPNVARLLDVGSRQSGQPYLVTEWVEGTPITRYCDDKKLALNKRLELFVAVCRGVQYAHQKGILHGDLEPSKVLVTEKESRPVPRVIDFGVARALGRKPTEGASDTEPGLDGKPEYMSPEQADANARDIDARSDVYGLGILLYELLTGTTPIAPERFRDVPAARALQMVREEEVPPPSKRLDDLGDRQSEVAEQRQVQPKAMAKALAGELDCVVMKALHRDPERRYATAHDLGRDVERHLANQPIEACPPSPTTRLWKLARRHTRLAAAVGFTLLLLLAAALGGIGLAAWSHNKEKGALEAEKKAEEAKTRAEKSEEKAKGKLQETEENLKVTARERDAARHAEKASRQEEEDIKAVLGFFKDKLLGAGRPADKSLTEAFWAEVQNQDRHVTLLQAAEMASSKATAVLRDRPLAEAAAREILGLAFLNVGKPSMAVPQLERALALREALQGFNESEVADCRNQLAVAYRLAGRTMEAARLFDENPNTPEHADALSARGVMLLAEKKPVEAELKLRQCLKIRQKNQPDDWTTFEAESLVGEALLQQKKYVDAEPMLLAAYQGLKKQRDTGPPEVRARIIKTIERLMRLYQALGQSDKEARWRVELKLAKPVKKD